MSMRIATINIPDSYLESFESLIELGFFNSRSQIVREALREFLDKEQQFIEEMKTDNFKKIKAIQLKKVNSS